MREARTEMKREARSRDREEEGGQGVWSEQGEGIEVKPNYRYNLEWKRSRRPGAKRTENRAKQSR